MIQVLPPVLSNGNQEAARVVSAVSRFVALPSVLQPQPPRWLVFTLYLNDSVPNITSVTMVSASLGLFCIASWLLAP